MATVSRKKNYLKMSAAELAAETAQFNEEFVVDGAKDLTEEQQQQWLRAKRKRGRPRVGAGAESICLTIERNLLRQADHVAETLGISRAQLFSAALVGLLAKETSRGSKPKR